ncbi:hypothetical protein RXV86_14455 [Alisedimentitalea sp. MJ-SS2]|uniref:hypothetical protein n=1 Tax=Aliisedimentitalea sp. MJ-SS2 TaxID=3049795 RepID=UPI0029068303|nr:hypothetical protein [Alisedimentitalea sp. MJ-SS2]MDU8928590.1 hypothetical protein [Alisedimentitalea sp. MJ-SS2]
MTQTKGRWALNIAAIVAILFGLMTILSGGSALFGSPETRAALGEVVPFVLWFNFCAGFAYVLAGVGLWLRERWAVVLAMLIFVGSAVVLVALDVHILRGGAYETRTLFAMSLRTLVWAVIAWVARGALLVRSENTGSSK